MESEGGIRCGKRMSLREDNVMVLKLPKELWDEPVDWFDDEAIITYLKKKDIKTVGEVVDRQDEISRKMWKGIKRKIGFAVLNVRPVKNDDK